MTSWSTAFRRPWCFVHIGGLGWGWVGWGGAGINVHVNLLGKYSRLCVYRSWRSLKEFLPAHMVLKHKDRGHSTMHPSVTQYVFMWCWRCTSDTPDPQRFLEELEQLLWKKKTSADVSWKCDQIFGFNIIYLYECLSLVIFWCSMQVKVRCKVVWQAVPTSSWHRMWKSRSVARSSGRLCQFHHDITFENT